MITHWPRGDHFDRILRRREARSTKPPPGSQGRCAHAGGVFIRDLLRALAHARVPHYIVGGVAVNLHGVPRLTYDIDPTGRADHRGRPAADRRGPRARRSRRRPGGGELLALVARASSARRSASAWSRSRWRGPAAVPRPGGGRGADVAAGHAGCAAHPRRDRTEAQSPQGWQGNSARSRVARGRARSGRDSRPSGWPGYSVRPTSASLGRPPGWRARRRRSPTWRAVTTPKASE